MDAPSADRYRQLLESVARLDSWDDAAGPIGVYHLRKVR